MKHWIEPIEEIEDDEYESISDDDISKLFEN